MQFGYELNLFLYHKMPKKIEKKFKKMTKNSEIPYQLNKLFTTTQDLNPKLIFKC